MTDPSPSPRADPPAVDETSPPNGEQLDQEAAERPKSLRLLPRITTDALRLAWASSPRLLIANVALKLVNGAGLAIALIFARNLVGDVLAANDRATAPGIGSAIPGGYIDQHENPHTAAERELREELNLALPAGDLLVVDWASPAGPRPRALVNFIFDGGRLTRDHDIRVDPDELETFGFHDPEQCRRLLPPRVAPRIEAALAARAKGTVICLIDGASPTPS
ncbi:NUDIX domain-containing protein [Phytohabitans sp. LJ34]|uniref:NUDIX domain-containing protein n=1 Tax=Phytohabitans sp. LJ34 TaxID=3452217 RepID=UPI003F89DE65